MALIDDYKWHLLMITHHGSYLSLCQLLVLYENINCTLGINYFSGILQDKCASFKFMKGSYTSSLSFYLYHLGVKDKSNINNTILLVCVLLLINSVLCTGGRWKQAVG